MAWIKILKEVCIDSVCGLGLGVVKGISGISFFTAEETEEINALKKLALSTVEKAPEFATSDLICEGIKQGQEKALKEFTKNASPEMVAAGVVTAAELVCSKSFKTRFAELLTGACLNLVGC